MKSWETIVTLALICIGCCLTMYQSNGHSWLAWPASISAMFAIILTVVQINKPKQ